MSHTPALPRPFIMIVDDDRVVHTITKRILESFRGTVYHCNDGQEALELAREIIPDLVITDALIPKLDGRELARTLKHEEATSHVKIAVMTGLYKATRYRIEAMRDFMVDAYVEKPIDAIKLWNLINSLRKAA